MPGSPNPLKDRLALLILPTLLVAALAFPLAHAASTGAGQTTAFNVLTYHDNNERTGWDDRETRLRPATVNVHQFGKIGFFPVDGKVDAQPLYVSAVRSHGQAVPVLYVATEADRLYALNARTGATLWEDTLLKAGETPSNDRHCNQVRPTIGVTATPVIDLRDGAHGTLFAVAMSKGPRGHYHQRLYALDLATGAERPGSPVTIRATYPGTGDGSHDGRIIFDPAQYKERPGLLLLRGRVYTFWSSNCDHRPYTGWIIAYTARGLKNPRVLDITPNGHDGGIWASGAGPAAGPGGHIYFMDGNGSFGRRFNRRGFPIDHDFGNAFIRLTVTGGRIRVSDYFNMDNTRAESRADEDLGSGGALLLPPLRGRHGRIRKLALGAGKDSHIYVVNRDHMGGFHPRQNDLWQELPHALRGPEFGMPAYFAHEIYFGAVGQPIRAFELRGARLVPRPVSVTPNRFPYPGATPSISSDGLHGGIVWAVANTDPAVLYAYRARNLSQELYNSNQAGPRDQFGPGNKFITPTIAQGRVFVGTRDGVAVFGLLHPSPPRSGTVPP